MNPADADPVGPALAQLVGAGIATAAHAIAPGLTAPHAAEREHVRRAVAKRRNEFAAGRLAARTALRGIGCPDTPLLADSDRVPLWPSGIAGSLSHSAEWAIAAVGRRDVVQAIGLDIERDDALTPDIARMICTPAERLRCNGWSAQLGFDAASLVFGAKEAWYKAHFPTYRRILEFSDAELLDIDPAGHFRICDLSGLFDGGETEGRFARSAGQVISLVVLPA